MFANHRGISQEYRGSKLDAGNNPHPVKIRVVIGALSPGYLWVLGGSSQDLYW